MSNPVVSDKMGHGLKPLAVKSKAHLLTIPCVGTNQYSGDISNTIICKVQHNPSYSDCYIDLTTKFIMTCQFKFPFSITTSSLNTFFLECGP